MLNGCPIVFTILDAMKAINDDTDTLQICVSCGNQFTGKFCNNCGEKVRQEHDRSFKHLMHEAFHFLTHFEGTFLTTLKTMIVSPGKFSLDFVSGVRRKYFKPLSFFLMVVIVYLLFPFYGGLNMRMAFYKENQLFGRLATYQIEEKIERKKISETQLTEKFEMKSEKTSKFLLFTTIPFMAVVSYVLAFRRRKYFFDHFIYATEIVSAFILFGFILLPLIHVGFIYAGIKLFNDESYIAMIVYTAIGIYSGISSRRMFKISAGLSVAFGIIFSLAMFLGIQFVYKFFLFEVTMLLVR